MSHFVCRLCVRKGWNMGKSNKFLGLTGSKKAPRHREAFLLVPRTGIEPALPCDNQILSLARLPVPPSGQLCQSFAFYHPGLLT